MYLKNWNGTIKHTCQEKWNFLSFFEAPNHKLIRCKKKYNIKNIEFLVYGTICTKLLCRAPRLVTKKSVLLYIYRIFEGKLSVHRICQCALNSGNINPLLTVFTHVLYTIAPSYFHGFLSLAHLYSYQIKAYCGRSQ